MYYNNSIKKHNIMIYNWLLSMNKYLFFKEVLLYYSLALITA